MRRKHIWLAGAAAGGALLAAWWFLGSERGDPRLAQYVRARPPVPVVFTSRTGPASLRAAAPAGPGYTYPGQGLWQESAGRLRLLTPRGTVHELTWGKLLPDGSTLIDVMSPSVSLDGRKIVFAGRKATPDPGRFRLYEVNVDGSGLRPLTGDPDDPGCTAAPPLRHRRAGDAALMPEAERRAIDYDDVDPIYLNFGDGRLAFVSSRTPDLGRGHARRSTTLWLLKGADRRPLTANRNNDRWPFLTRANVVIFSLWSRNVEVVTADGRDIRPHEPGEPSATAPTDAWMGAFTQAVGSHFGALVKPHVPVWRPRPLFNGRIVFMTSFAYPAFDMDASTLPALQVVQAEPGLLQSVPSARPAGEPLPRQRDVRLLRGPAADAAGRPLSLATPSPCPPNGVLLAGAPLGPGGAAPRPADYGLYLARDDWETESEAVSAAQADLRLLFDDPDFVDAEPVAVYPRPLRAQDAVKEGSSPRERLPRELKLAGGTVYRGPVGTLFNSALYARLLGELPGQQTDAGAGPIFDAPPRGAIASIRVYASRRDAFDDPQVPRSPGRWELLVEAAANGDTFGAPVPAGVPTVLAGFGSDGRIVRWTSAAADKEGRRATFYAFAGDHYSGARPGGQHFCIGCHPGHSGLTREVHSRHAESLK